MMSLYFRNKKHCTFLHGKRKWHCMLLFLIVMNIFMLSSCYYDKEQKQHRNTSSCKTQKDSLSFVNKHHYTINYNFIVKSNSLSLLVQQPEEFINKLPTNNIHVNKHDRLVVADIRIIPTDPKDSVWIQVARDQHTFGWIHESQLLVSVMPADPISQFIAIFSDTHLLIFLIIISIISVTYLMRTIYRRNAKIVHFNDIASFYPTLLALLVAIAATLYASIQMFAPNIWQEFYYHPTLNPFSVPIILSVFLLSIWAMLIIGLAVIDVIRHQLTPSDGILYLAGLAGVCAINYIVFSITTLYYIGYIILILYIYFAIHTYLRQLHSNYICGNCGALMKHKGKCPVCGTINQ